MPPERPAGRYRIGEFEFDAGSGELHRAGDDVRRLPPQPAHLLTLLAARGGGLVTRDEIRDALWPGVEIDFDTGLHFCVRQVRAALGDEADEPRYVETLPRRGYRLKAEAVAVEAAPAAAPRPPAPAGTPASALTGAWAVGAAAFALVAIAAIAYFAAGTQSPPVPPRVGILPSVPPAGDVRFDGTSAIAESILEALEAEIAAGRADIVGPTTTAAFVRPGGSLKDLAREYKLGHLVHVRFVPDAQRPFLLAELIRAEDGAHVWVRRYESWPDARAIGRDVAAAIVERLDLNGS